jgi:hypothetical protein
VAIPKALVNLTLTTQSRSPEGRKCVCGMDAAKPLLQNRQGNARAQDRDRVVPPGAVRGAREE